MPAGWTILGAPLDSSGSGRGEERAPDALRVAGIAAAVGAPDLGDATSLLRPATRDAASGVIAVEALRKASSALADAVAGVLRSGRRPLVLGGDCALLPGALAGCRSVGLAPGLWMVDGHPDMLDGTSSPTGEAADMGLAIALGAGSTGRAELVDEPPLLAAERTVVLGLRPPGMYPDNDAELAALPDAVLWRDTHAIADRGPRASGVEAAGALVGEAGTAWLHIDLDVLDEAVMGAVTYPQAKGLTWQELRELLGPLACSPGLVGISVSDLVPDRDPGGLNARRTVELLAELCASEAAPARPRNLPFP